LRGFKVGYSGPKPKTCLGYRPCSPVFSPATTSCCQKVKNVAGHLPPKWAITGAITCLQTISAYMGFKKFPDKRYKTSGSSWKEGSPRIFGSNFPIISCCPGPAGSMPILLLGLSGTGEAREDLTDRFPSRYRSTKQAASSKIPVQTSLLRLPKYSPEYPRRAIA